jgi:nitrite reductase/ring-hydroxylating ferredoxin subunit
MTTWPIALERDIQPFGLARAALEGRELLLWRDDGGQIHVWSDLCPHRSVRLSAGRNVGDCVQSAYHGWRFGANGALVAIPAQHDRPLPDIRVKVVNSEVAFGFVWATLEGQHLSPPEFSAQKDEVLLRPLPINTSAEAVRANLSRLPAIRLIVTPTSSASCKLFGFAKAKNQATSLQTARWANHCLNGLRRFVEARAAS